jgi:tetratricopeptide (TPR) repeat protein
MRQIALVALMGLASVGAARAQTSLDAQKRREAEIAYRRGEERMRAESYEEAATHFRTAIKLDPLMSMAHYSLGQTQMALKSYPEAVEAYLGCRESFERIAALSTQDRNAIEKAREDEIRELKDSLLRVQQGKIKGNTMALEVGIQERLRVLEGSRMKGHEERLGVPAEVMLALGSAYFRNGQLVEAEPAYKEAVQTDPKLGPAHNNLAVIYMLSQRYPEAKDALQRAEKSGFPVNPALKSDLESRARAAGAQR